MTNKILVTYASRTGSTCKVAQEIGKILSTSGAAVDIVAMHEVEDISTYIAVIAGSPIQNRSWLPEAMAFIQKNRVELAKKPFAMFTLCMTLAMKNGEKYRPDVIEWLSPVRRLVRPVSEGLFAGVLDISKIPSFGDRLKFRLSVLFGVWSEGDHRDWVSIYDWANDLSSQLL
jgi:menaquinone-dependent protoporphyrinogen oxidase